MKKSIFIFILSVLTLSQIHADTTTHIYSTMPAPIENKPIEKPESLFETPGYNQALVGVGFLGVISVVGGFAYLLTKKKH